MASMETSLVADRQEVVRLFPEYNRDADSVYLGSIRYL
jgi:hypothetical protein